MLLGAFRFYFNPLLPLSLCNILLIMNFENGYLERKRIFGTLEVSLRRSHQIGNRPMSTVEQNESKKFRPAVGARTPLQYRTNHDSAGDQSTTMGQKYSYIAYSSFTTLLIYMYYHGKVFCPIIVRTEPILDVISIRGNVYFFTYTNNNAFCALISHCYW